MVYESVLNPGEFPHRFAEAWNRYDARGIAALFVEDADFVNVTGRWWDNREDIWRAHDFGLRIIFQHSKAEVLEVKVKELGDEVAVVHCKFKIVGQTQNKDEKVVGDRETMFLFVAQRQENGEWLSVSAQNTDINVEQTHIRDEGGELRAVSYKEKIRISADYNKKE